MSIEFNCTACGQRLRIGSEHAGSTTKCPHCETAQLAPASDYEEPVPMATIAGTPEEPINPFREAPITGNPYVTPKVFVTSAVEDVLSRFELANPILRLGAAFLDWLFFLACWIPGVILTSFLDQLQSAFADVVGSSVLVACLAAGAGLQWYLISTRGQSLGKLVAGIRIINRGGFPPGFLHGIVFRQWLFAIFLPCWPIAGLLYLFDSLFVFSKSHQCLHDVVASTYVVMGKYKVESH